MSSSFSLYTVCLTTLFVSSAYGMDCSFIGSDKINDKLFSSCPTPVFAITNPERSYCCPTTDGSFTCCDLPTFLLTGILIPVIIIGVVLSLVISCICCFCCPFCCIYKRRNGRGFKPSLKQHFKVPVLFSGAAFMEDDLPINLKSEGQLSAAIMLPRYQSLAWQIVQNIGGNSDNIISPAF